jgi:predicted transcriptional regulator
MDPISIVDTCRSLSDEKSLTLFNMVAFTLPREIRAVLTGLALTRKQYYSRMNHFINAGIITRKCGKYFLTSFGKVVYEFHLMIEQAAENYWELKAIDLIESTIPDNGLSAEKREKLIETLIESMHIKIWQAILLSDRNNFIGPLANNTTKEERQDIRNINIIGG